MKYRKYFWHLSAVFCAMWAVLFVTERKMKSYYFEFVLVQIGCYVIVTVPMNDSWCLTVLPPIVFCFRIIANRLSQPEAKWVFRSPKTNSNRAPLYVRNASHHYSSVSPTKLEYCSVVSTILSVTRGARNFS